MARHASITKDGLKTRKRACVQETGISVCVCTKTGKSVCVQRTGKCTCVQKTENLVCVQRTGTLLSAG